MSLLDYGLAYAQQKAAMTARQWRSLSDVAITMTEMLIVESPAKAWEMVARAVDAHHAHSPAGVLEAGEVATAALSELETLAGQMGPDAGGRQTLGDAILSAEEACKVIAEILGRVEGAAPTEGGQL